MARQQRPVERSGGDVLFFPVLGKDDLLDQRIDRGIGYSRKVLRTLSIGRGGSPEIPLLVARVEVWPQTFQIMS